MDNIRPEETLREVTLERDLYLRLLELHQHEEVEPFLEQALDLLVDTSKAERGYIELHDPESLDCRPRWWHSKGISDEEIAGVRAQLSGNLIAEALVRGEVVESACAVSDSRYQDHESVRRNSIRAVLCAPIGLQQPVGVLYLQGRVGDTPFEQSDRRRAQAFAQYIGPHALRIIARRNERDENDPTRALREELEVSELLGRTPELAEILAGIASMAKSDEAVLLTGPAGVGKSLTARLIHKNSERRDAPFVHVECGRGEPAEEQLLGENAREGLLAAKGGTLYVEDVGDLSKAAQLHLLELLGGCRVAPGKGQTPCSIDLRLLVSSSADPRELVRDGVLRRDLCDRLEQKIFDLASLSRRIDDISMLAQHFCALVCESHRLPQLRLSFAAVTALEDHDWTGNLDELESLLQLAALAASQRGLCMIERRHLFPGLGGDSLEDDPSWIARNHQFQSNLLDETLRECDWNVAKTARKLGLARSHVYNKIKKFELRRK